MRHGIALDQRTVESTEGVSQRLPGREFMRWAPSPVGATVSCTSELGVYPGLARL